MAVGASEPTVVASKDGRIGMKSQMQVHFHTFHQLAWAKEQKYDSKLHFFTCMLKINELELCRSMLQQIIGLSMVLILLHSCKPSRRSLRTLKILHSSPTFLNSNDAFFCTNKVEPFFIPSFRSFTLMP